MEAAWIAVIGVLGGSALTTISGIVTNQLKTRSDRSNLERSRKWALEDAERQLRLQKKTDEFRIYNEVLKLHGELRLVTESGQGGLHAFQLDKYKETIRPILYRNLELLAGNVRRIVQEIDDTAYNEYPEEAREVWLHDMASLYESLVTELELLYSKE